LFEALWKASDDAEEQDTEQEPEPPQAKKRSGRQPLAKDLIRERMVHDLPEAEKHCGCCGKDLRLIAEETSKRYEYIPASVKVIDVGTEGTCARSTLAIAR
jgi:transposase